MCGHFACPQHSLELQGALVLACFATFTHSAAKLFGTDVAAALALITAVQFHLPFYCSRLLPNTFALALTCLAYSSWLQRRHASRTILLMVLNAVSAPCWLPLACLPDAPASRERRSRCVLADASCANL